MTTLPNECYYLIFNNFQHNYKNLFSCALVNRQWCRVIIPILWSEPKYHFNDTSLIRIFLLTLNVEEQAQLIPFKISLPSHPKPLFEYTSYITSVTNDFYRWIGELLHSYEGYELDFELVNAVKSSLLSMFLRTGENLKNLYLDEITCNQLMLEILYKNTTVTSMDLRSSDGFNSAMIEELSKFLKNKNSILTSLNLINIQLGSNEMKTLLEALYDNTEINYLSFHDYHIDTEGGKMFAKFLCKNTTLISLNLYGGNLSFYGKPLMEALMDALCKNNTLKILKLSFNAFGLEEELALADAICKNTTLASLDLSENNFGYEGGKVLADALCKNTTLTSLDLSGNDLGFEGGEALAVALCKNTTLTSLDLSENDFEFGGKALVNAICKNTTLKSLKIRGMLRDLSFDNIGSEGGKALADMLCNNITLTSLDISYNYIGPIGGKALADALCKNISLENLNLQCNNLGPKGGRALADSLCKNTSLTSLNLSWNNLGPKGGKALANALCKNTTLISLDLSANELGFEGGKAFADALCKNSTLTSLNLQSNKINFKIESNNQNIEILQNVTHQQ
ncbi:hypothetical protein C2G38_1767612 [Gigaspora rosea]|uniref:Uncharacterized protein n=1 Tax=Gigaspora rosea TaxID=44941 RepID=A0A397US54_9GLOM|nr:hypothetical protein C2G38_1767612 [Gigaspora rosea]